MNSYANAGDGLRKMFIAQVGMIVCSVLAVVPLVSILATIGDNCICGIKPGGLI